MVLRLDPTIPPLPNLHNCMAGQQSAFLSDTFKVGDRQRKLEVRATHLPGSFRAVSKTPRVLQDGAAHK